MILDFEKILEESEKLNSTNHLQEMARIGNVGNFLISVFSNEGPIPHFHFMNTTTGAHGCIKILECSYFEHGKYKAKLNSGERKELQLFLEEQTFEKIYRDGTTNFNVICHEWNKNNPKHTIDIDTKIPDYRNLQ